MWNVASLGYAILPGTEEEIPQYRIVPLPMPKEWPLPGMGEKAPPGVAVREKDNKLLWIAAGIAIGYLLFGKGREPSRALPAPRG